MRTFIKSLRFSFSERESSENGPGLRIAATGQLSTVEGNASIQQAIAMLLRTTPGERVGRPSYGCQLHRLLFTPNDNTTAGLAIHYVREAIENWEPRVEIIALDADADPENPESLLIFLDYQVLATRQRESLILRL